MPLRFRIKYDDRNVTPNHSYALQARITLGDQTLFDRAVCEVHRVSMERRVVPVQYGLPVFEYPLEVFNRSFPHYRDHVLGGCCLGEQKTGKTFICAECVSVACA